MSILRKGKMMLKGKTIAALTLGCKVNQYETDGMLASLKEAGAEIVNFDQNADVYIINTCSVTNMADKKSRQMIHRAKKQNPNAVVVAAGCYVQAAKEQLESDSSIDLIISNNRKKDIVALLIDYLNEENALDNFVDIGKEQEFETISYYEPQEHTRAYVKIQDGCNQFCSYCIIPYVRGRIRSRELSSVLEEVRKLAQNGIKEVILTGIHISSYGIDKDNGILLIDLIDEISKIESIERIRLGSLEPGIITPDFVSRIAANKKVCPHFHLSLQSGCDSVLKRMNRKYTCDDYFEKCELLREAYDRPAITTDVIVGFPGETDEEFAKTVAYLKKLNLYEMHIFKYSPRKGTVAAKMSGQVHPEIKTARSDVLLALSSENKAAYETSFEGEELTVLIEEEIIKNGKRYYRGHTERYMDILISEEDMQSDASLINHFVSVIYNKNDTIR